MTLDLNILLNLSIMLLFGMLCGRAVKHIKLPNVTGYLLAGLLLGPYFFRAFGWDFSVLSVEFVQNMDIVSEIALGFIAFSIGNAFKFSFFKRVGMAPVIIAILESAVADFLVVIALLLTGHDLAFSLVLGAIAAATAPAATTMVIKQYRAKGKLTELLLAVVAIDDATTLMLFSASATVARSILSPGSKNILLSMLVPIGEILADLGVGIGLGFVLLIPLRYFKKRGNRLCLVTGFIFMGAGLSQLLGLSSLLVCMSLGAAVANVCKDEVEIMNIADSITQPIFLLFFVASGAGLQLSVLATVGAVGAIFIIVRSMGKIAGTWLGGKLCHCDHNVNTFMGPCLLPMAGVAIGLSLVSNKVIPEYAPQIRAVVLAATLVYELVGPGITKFCLVKAGEIKEEARHKHTLRTI